MSIGSSPLFSRYSVEIAKLAVEHRLPTMFVLRYYVENRRAHELSAWPAFTCVLAQLTIAADVFLEVPCLSSRSL